MTQYELCACCGKPKKPKSGNATQKAETWAGHRYGLQALKPALEPIIVFQKPYPRKGKTWESITATGAGALWIDGGRIGTSETLAAHHSTGRGVAMAGNASENWPSPYESGDAGKFTHTAGRWPANFFLTHTPACNGTCAPDCPVRLLGVDLPVFLRYNEEKQECALCGDKLSRDASTYAGKSRASNTSNLPTDGYGNRQTELSRTVTRYTIKTTTHLITICPTCRWSLPNGIATIINDLEKTIKSLMELSCESVSGAGSINHLIATASARLALITDIASCANVSINESGAQVTQPTAHSITASGESASVSRFFHNSDWAHEVAEQLAEAEPVRYVAKAGRKERDAGLEAFAEYTDMDLTSGDRARENARAGTNRNGPKSARNPHPTIKPITLTRWLATLLLPPAAYAPRRILVPFAGAGSEAIGAMLAGWEDVIGIEREREYADIARARIAHWAAQERQEAML